MEEIQQTNSVSNEPEKVSENLNETTQIFCMGNDLLFSDDGDHRIWEKVNKKIPVWSAVNRDGTNRDGRLAYRDFFLQ